MAETTEIAWCDATFNPWVGCSKVSPACDNCYAEVWAKRSGMAVWGGDRVRTSAAYWKQPLKWDRLAVGNGRRTRVFCASLADVFDNQVPPEWRDDLWALIRATPHLDWLLLTKRVANIKGMLPPDWGRGFRNVWLGASVVTKAEALRDIGRLSENRARVLFLSVEPMIERLDIRAQLEDHLVDWVIVGGESGSKARPMQLEWAHTIREDCRRTDTRFFMKQGSQANWPRFRDFDQFPKGLQVREWPGDD